MPLDQPHQVPLSSPPAIRTGTSCAGATSSGFLSGSSRGRIGFGQILPLLSPSELPTQMLPYLVIPPTQITSSTEPGDSTSPSSSSPSLPAAATTYTPSSMASSTDCSSASVEKKPEPNPWSPPRLSDTMSACCSTHQSTASAICSSSPVPSSPIALATSRLTPGALPCSPSRATTMPAIAVPCPSLSYGCSMPSMASNHPANSSCSRSGCSRSMPESTMHSTTPPPSPPTALKPVRSRYSSSQVNSAEGGPPMLTPSIPDHTHSIMIATLSSTMRPAEMPMTTPNASLL